MVNQKTYVSKILTLILCAVVALSVFWRGGMVSSAADGVYIFHESSNTPGIAQTPLSLRVGFGETLDYTLSFSGYTGELDSPKMVFYFFAPAYTVEDYFSTGNNYTVWVDNWRMTVGGNTYKASYLADNVSVFNVPMSAGVSLHYLIECDVHIRITQVANPTFYTVDNGHITESHVYGYNCPIVKVSLNHSGDSSFDYTGNAYVTDSQQQQLTQQQTEQQHQDSQTQTDAIKDQTQKQQEASEKQLEEQQKQTAIQEEQKETTRGIFGKITSFFDGFGDMVKGFFVPSSDELMTFLDEVNTWFGDRLGFIYYPFDFAVQVVQAFALGDANQQFSVPALTLNILGEQYTIWEAFAVDLDAMGIFTYVRYFTSAILCLGVGKLAVDKWSDWIGGKRG